MGAPVNDQLGPSQDAQSAPTLRFNQGRTNNAFEHFLWKILRLQCFNDALLVDGDHCAIGCFDKFVVAILKFAPSLRSKSAVHLVSLGAIQSFGLFCLALQFNKLLSNLLNRHFWSFYLHFDVVGDLSGGLTTKVSGAGATKVRRVPTQAMRMPKAWPVLASA